MESLAGLMALRDVQRAADDDLAAFVGLIDTKQQAYFTQHGRFVQLPRLLNDVPEDGSDLRTQPGRRAPDDGQRWDAFSVSVPARLACQVAVGIYHGPAGRGYVVIQRLRFSGQVYEKVTNFGPQNGMATRWHAEDG